MYQLYYSPGACSMAPHVILNELNVPFEVINVNAADGKGKNPEFLKANPRGAVPVLVADGQVIREGAAIMSWLLDKHQSPMLPAITVNGGKDRATALEWLMFGNASLHPAYGKAFFLMKNPVDKAAGDKLFAVALEDINKKWADIDAQLAKSKYICGDNITAADILFTVIANWGGHFATRPTLGENVKRLVKEISQRPSYQKALKAENVEYKAAA